MSLNLGATEKVTGWGGSDSAHRSPVVLEFPNKLMFDLTVKKGASPQRSRRIVNLSASFDPPENNLDLGMIYKAGEKRKAERNKKLSKLAKIDLKKTRVPTHRNINPKLLGSSKF